LVVFASATGVIKLVEIKANTKEIFEVKLNKLALFFTAQLCRG
jgi:hypothetical protein